MKKEIIILGDIEMGAGNITDDFISDNVLSKLILSLKQRTNPIDLILNGDTLDYLKCPAFIDGRKAYPRYVTVEMSLNKTKLIYKAHEKVFQALREFLQEKKNRLFFIIGNHDYDLVYKKVQERIKSYLQPKGNIFFALKYNQHKVYAEHGQQYDALHMMNPQKYFLSHKGRTFLNFPWMTFSVFSKILYFKEKYPFMERIKPIPTLAEKHQKMHHEIKHESLKYFFKGIFYYPWRYYHNPTYRFPKTILGELWRCLINMKLDMEDVIEVFKRKKKIKFRNDKIYVISHVHKYYQEEKGNWIIIHPDTWRDEYILNGEKRTLTAKKKNYVQITVDDDEILSWKIISPKIRRKILPFDEVMKDEVKYLDIAAKEEGFAHNYYL